MIPVTQQADSSGRIRVPISGYGFLIKPAGNAPGYFPITVFAYGAHGPERFVVRESKHITARPFYELHVEDAPASTTFEIDVATRPGEQLEQGVGVQKAMPIASNGAEALAAADPVGDVGWEIQPNQTGWTFFMAGAQVCTIWQQDPDGNWFATADTIDPAAESVAYRDCFANAGRLYLRPAAAGDTCRAYRHTESR